MVTVNIHLTSSKIFAILAFAVVSTYAFVNKDHIPMTTALPSLTALLSAKIYKDVKTNNRNSGGH